MIYLSNLKCKFFSYRRELSSLIKPAKDENDPNEQNRINEERENKKSTAYRVLILIRHGQYHDSEKHDKDRKLTDLGMSF